MNENLIEQPREHVDEALQAADAKLLGLASTRAMMDVLAREVRALREHLADADLQRRLDAVKIARVEALGSGSGYRMGDETLVKLGDVRAALRGRP